MATLRIAHAALPPLGDDSGNGWLPIEGLPRDAPRALRTLCRMHAYARPHGSAAAGAFAARYLDTLQGVRADAAGNRIGVVPLPDGAPPRVAFCSHYDTVASSSGQAALRYCPRTGLLSLASPEAGCLGADDTAGVWLMRRMYRARVPGLYIWHAGEEVGCIGSSHIAERTPDVLHGIEATVAFDRKGTNEIITHQSGGRCASDTFADALAIALARHGLTSYEPSPNGVYTDNVNYSDIVPENVNVAVGYSAQHSIAETLDTRHLMRLARACIAIDWHALPIERDPMEACADWIVGERAIITGNSLSDSAFDLSLRVASEGIYAMPEHVMTIERARRLIEEAAEILADAGL